MVRFVSIPVALALLWQTGCASRPAPAPSSFLDVSGMDRSVAPGDNFYHYANGAWYKATAIPADKSSYGPGVVLNEELRKRMQSLIQENAKAPKSDDEKKIAALYSSYMDEAAIEQKGVTPLKPAFDAIAAINDKKALARFIGSQLRADVDALNSTNFQTSRLFGIWITQGLTDPAHSYPYLMQGGLGLPERDYYLSPTPHMAELRKQYQDHVAAMLKLAGFSDPAARAARIFALESKMAKHHATRVESEDVHNAVTWTRSDLLAKAPGIDWAAVLEASQLKDAQSLIIWHPKAIPGLAALVASEPLESWKDWAAYHTLERSSSLLSKPFVEESFRFYGKALQGVQEMEPRWQRAVDATSDLLGSAVGKLYVEKCFPAATKAAVQKMADNLTAAFAKRIDALTWMSPQTKIRAKQKLATLKVGVGYPDRWIDISSLEIKPDDLVGNVQRVSLFEYRRQLAKLKQPVDRSEWWMTPQTINAVNLPLQNALNFPAAYLQPPYYNPSADDAFNYGSLGATIGHEISHSFDDQGALFDSEGRLADWWTKDDYSHFKTAGEALAAQFDAYKPFPDLAINGHQTLSENIADVAGLLVAYDAYKASLGGKPDSIKDGFTGEQRFFLSYAQSWRDKTRDQALRAQIATDGHAPAEYRASTVRNLDPWYAAFDIKPPQKLYLAPEKRVRVW